MFQYICQCCRYALILLVLLVAAFLNSLASAATVIMRVDGTSGSATNANPAPDGTAWGSDAYLYLQDAIDAADSYLNLTGHESDTVQIWVRGSNQNGGLKYYPDDGANVSNDVRTESFHLRTHVSIYGGFNASETSLENRNPSTNITILDGDIGTADTATDNSYHVVSAADSSISATNCQLDGFTIRHGYANGSDIQDSHP